MAQKVITEPVKLTVGEGQCGDGCGAKLKNPKGRFNQGHDSRLKSLLHAAHRGGATVSFNGKAKPAAEHLKANGWPLPAPKAARKPMSAETKAKLRAKTKKAPSRVQKAKRPKARAKA